MSNLLQAPIIKHNGNKDQDSQHWGKAIRTHELEAAFASCLGAKDFAMYKVMMFLSGNAAEKFRVSESTIMERCNISESGYKNARKKLVKMGWIDHVPSEYIQVNFNKIYSDYDDYRQGCFENTPSSSETAQLTAPQAVYSWNQGNSSEKGLGFSENTYNNINNNIPNNMIDNNIGYNILRCENTPSAPAQSASASGVSSQPLREILFTREELENARREINAWFGIELRKLEKKYDANDLSGDGCRRMMASDEYAKLQKEYDDKREAYKQKYGVKC